MDDIRENILNSVADLVSNLFFYDRKDDEILPKGAIEKAISNGEITLEEIVSQFENSCKRAIG